MLTTLCKHNGKVTELTEFKEPSKRMVKKYSYALAFIMVNKIIAYPPENIKGYTKSV